MTERRQRDTASMFASTAIGLAAVALAFVGFSAFRERPEPSTAVAAVPDPSNSDRPVIALNTDDDAVADPAALPADILSAAAAAMAGVTSVEFELDRTGAPIFIDQFESIALDHLRGQFKVPNQAQAELTVTVNDNLVTKLGAVAIVDEVWISNPVTGDFETLPDGYDIDPSRFFDPSGGWQPLLANLFDVTLVGIDDQGGDRYHITGTAPASEVRNITVVLVRGQDVPVEIWIHPGSFLVTAAKFTTTIGGADAEWELELSRYGDEFTINPPENVRN